MHLLSHLRSGVPSDMTYSHFESINPHRELIRKAFAADVLNKYGGHLYTFINYEVRYAPEWEVLRVCCQAVPVWEELGGGPVWEPTYIRCDMYQL